MNDDEKKFLQSMLGKRSRTEVKRLFALVRAHSDRALLAASQARTTKAKRAPDRLLRDVQRALRPVMAPAREKAEMLVDHMAKGRRRKTSTAPKGLSDALRQLRAAHSEAQIAAGAHSLAARLAQRYGDRDSVV
ncbi:MAG: hypothetical protein R3C25_10855 [Hyphomonadaceae bacterium]